jgi:hypothetical protein
MKTQKRSAAAMEQIMEAVCLRMMSEESRTNGDYKAKI